MITSYIQNSWISEYHLPPPLFFLFLLRCQTLLHTWKWIKVKQTGMKLRVKRLNGGYCHETFQRSLLHTLWEKRQWMTWHLKWMTAHCKCIFFLHINMLKSQKALCACARSLKKSLKQHPRKCDHEQGCRHFLEFVYSKCSVLKNVYKHEASHTDCHFFFFYKAILRLCRWNSASCAYCSIMYKPDG